MTRKASLSLSVNAIIILILAIVMLGLGLGFIRGMFGKVSTQIEEQVSSEPEPHIPTSFSPITLSRESIITQAGNKEIMKVSIFNPSNSNWLTAKPLIECTDFIDPADASAQTANAKTIEQGKFVTFNLLVTIPSSPPDTKLCVMKIQNDGAEVTGHSKDFTIKINE